MIQSLLDEKLAKIVLSIRHDSALEAERLGDRWSTECLSERGATILIVGGGESIILSLHRLDEMFVLDPEIWKMTFSERSHGGDAP